MGSRLLIAIFLNENLVHILSEYFSKISHSFFNFLLIYLFLSNSKILAFEKLKLITSRALATLTTFIVLANKFVIQNYT